MTHEIDQGRLERFIGQLAGDGATACSYALAYIGDRLGLFAALAQQGPVTSDELADRARLDRRYVREWLAAMATAGYVDYAAQKFWLSPEHAAVLADDRTPCFMGGLVQGVHGVISAAPRLLGAFRDGGGVPHAEYPEVFEFQERLTAPAFEHHLVQSWIPAIPELVTKLERGCTAVDVGCGGGRLSILLARAFPRSTFRGFDADVGAVDRARASAEREGVARRCSFEVLDCSRLPVGEFELVTAFDAIHDAADPIAVLAAIRNGLKPDGIFLWGEFNVGSSLEENLGSPIAKLMYAVSLLHCIPVSRANGDGAALGAVLGPERARELAREAGFSQFRRLPIEDPFQVIYDARR